jgi:hypothetical protein
MESERTMWENRELNRIGREHGGQFLDGEGRTQINLKPAHRPSIYTANFAIKDIAQEGSRRSTNRLTTQRFIYGLSNQQSG